MNNNLTIYKCVILIMAWIIISFTPVSRWLESDIRLHMIIQLPLLAALGFWLTNVLRQRLSIQADIKLAGYSSVIAASFATLYWMIPRSLDATLSYEIYAYLKYISIPMFIGAPVALGWHKVSPIFRGFIVIEFLAMLFRLGWLYRESPIRLCSNYGLYEQNSLGNYFLVIAFLLSLYWTAKCFYPSNKIRLSE